jgi:DNA polymerase (family 10)
LNNQEVAQIFENIADMLSIKGEIIYKTLAYRRAADSIRAQTRSVEDIWRDGKLKDIDGVGDAIATKMDALFSQGEMPFYEELKSEVPVGLVEMLKVGDVGPKKAAMFWKEMGITDLDALEKAADEGKLRDLDGMGAKSEARILEGIRAFRRRQTGRISLGDAWPTAEDFLVRLRDIPGVKAAEAAGSLRRWRETVGDLDLLVGSSHPVDVMQAFLDFPEIGRVLGQGETKASVELNNGLRMQIWVHPPERFGSALQYATGSKEHSVKLREWALKQGLSLSEHGFKREDDTEILCADEASVYEALGLPWIPPELREDRGELEAAKAGELPDLVNLEDIRGELHAHSDWSDGQLTLEDMARGAQESGLDYLLISDHSQSLGVTNGLSVERLRSQRQAIDELQAKLGDSFRLYQGAEVEILADGTLDYPDDVLEGLDVVVASLHTSLRQSREKVTKRLLRAIRNQHVDIIGHLTGRLIGSRDAADLDIEAIFAEAAEHGVVLEINSNPERLDLNDVHARRAVEVGCKLAINTDAHHTDHYAFRRYGIGTARRGWVTAGDVINSLSLKDFEAWRAARN